MTLQGCCRVTFRCQSQDQRRVVRQTVNIYLITDARIDFLSLAGRQLVYRVEADGRSVYWRPLPVDFP
jgi:hypothetical protein